MIRYILSRIGFGLLVLFLLSIFVFVLFYVTPSDPARIIAGDKATEELMAQIRVNLGLDKPIWEQYLIFLGSLLQGDLGYSYRSSLPVAELVMSRIPVTMSLVFGGVVVWLAIGIPIGLASAKRPGSVRDRLGQAFALVGISFPTFVLGMLALYTLYFLPTRFGITLFPPSGYVPFTTDPLQWAWHLMLPWLTLALVTAAVYARLTRGQMLDVLGEDYVRTARAKGLTERRVIYVHAFRSAMPPLVTQLGIDIGLMLGGVIVIEQVFGLQGVGALAISSVSMQDRPVVIAIVLLGGVFVAVSNLVVDLFYALLDSRVRTRAH
ncbi:ABC transporter permease [Microbacterium esteraromaticum]|uniref:ABC transporter permease n=1 Tax=Microbacterium esteraromaticum TaxID=57043 RepID=A0A939DYX2_9MICO|nr:ABC transporter permease [Microbacterium esteraromaticum]MBN8206538.1 ABC transporter permease [Microbacterium esteraromaticum]MBN8416693.1 ABC transporter permease [Microbacterium esteraromaticum]MBN8425322.1 ABC transporter permease [Microbacterium esteraromaticum]MCA1307880.1 ABC transporter permease [Microbacterium esteraromaticum]